jgi:hypothetical protein
MHKSMIYAACCLMIVLTSCGKPEERVTEVKNGDFKIVVRSREFYHSGTVIVDVCLTEASNPKFPEKRIQCFLRGDDFSGLSVEWRSEREIEISFACGRVASFQNYAVVSPSGSLPQEFHAILHDRCESLLGNAPRG